MRPKSCNKGLRSAPCSAASGNKRAKGLLVNKVKEIKPTPIMPMTANTLACIVNGKLLLNRLTAIVHKPKINTHSSNEPSCPPHTALILYCIGKAVLEFCAT